MKRIFFVGLVVMSTIAHAQVNFKKIDSLAQAYGYISPSWFGANGDGITDNVPAFNLLNEYLYQKKGFEIKPIVIVSGVYRITEPIILGRKFCEAEVLLNKFKVDDATKVNYQAYVDSRRFNSIEIIGSGGTIFWGDFTAEKLTPLLFYNVQGDTRGRLSPEIYNCKISNCLFVGKNYFAQSSALYYAPQKYDGNNQAGIASSYNTFLTIEKCSFIGFKEGIILNNCTNSQINNCYFKYCQRAHFTIQSASSSINNCWVSFCNKGFELRSAQLSITNLYVNSCNIGVHFGAGVSTMRGCYFESLNTTLSQIIVGDSIGSSYYVNDERMVTDGITLEGCTVLAQSNGKNATSLLMQESARRLMIIGGQMESSNKILKSTANKLTVWGTKGVFPAATNFLP